MTKKYRRPFILFDLIAGCPFKRSPKGFALQARFNQNGYQAQETLGLSKNRRRKTLQRHHQKNRTQKINGRKAQGTTS